MPEPAGAGFAAYERGDYATALQLLRPLAEAGDANAQFHLGRIHLGGRGVAKNETEAAQWFRRAADHQGDPYEFLIDQAAMLASDP